MCNLIICIDIGHGDTTASYIDLAQSDEVKALNIVPLQEKLQKKQPSVIYGVPIEGMPNKYKYSLEKNSGRIFTGFKQRIAEDNEMQMAFREFIKLVYQKLLDNNKDVFFEDNGEPREFKLYIAAPTVWTNDEKRAYQRFVEETLEHPIEWVINESDAAYYNHRKNGNVLIIDYGSSTIDYTLMINDQKAPIDNFSKMLGASHIEEYMLCKCLSEQRNIDIYNKTKQLLEGTNLRYIDPNSVLKLEFRQKKEIYYTLQRINSNGGDDKIRYNVLYRTTGNEEYKTNDYSFEFDFDYERDFATYKNQVKMSLEELKCEVVNRLGECVLDRVILSGGASQMLWFEQMCIECFNGIATEIIRDVNNCSYVVSDGIAKYALAQKRCIDKIQDRLNKMQTTSAWPGDYNFYEYAYVTAKKDVVLKYISEPIKEICEEYATMTNDESAQYFIDRIKERCMIVIESDECKKEFKQHLKTILCENIFSEIKNILTSTLDINPDKIVNLRIPEPNFELDFSDISNLYNSIEIWVKDAYKKSHVRNGEFINPDDDILSRVWKFAVARCGFTPDKPRALAMRKDLAQATNKHINSKDAKIDMSEDEIEYFSGDDAPYLDILEEYAKQCAYQLFYSNELFQNAR